MLLCLSDRNQFLYLCRRQSRMKRQKKKCSQTSSSRLFRCRPLFMVKTTSVFQTILCPGPQRTWRVTVITTQGNKGVTVLSRIHTLWLPHRGPLCRTTGPASLSRWSVLNLQITPQNRSPPGLRWALFRPQDTATCPQASWQQINEHQLQKTQNC